MMTSEKLFLHQSIDKLSSHEAQFLTEIIREILGDNLIEELPENEVPKHIAILNEMNKGHYVCLDDLGI